MMCVTRLYLGVHLGLPAPWGEPQLCLATTSGSGLSARVPCRISGGTGGAGVPPALDRCEGGVRGKDRVGLARWDGQVILERAFFCLLLVALREGAGKRIALPTRLIKLEHGAIEGIIGTRDEGHTGGWAVTCGLSRCI